MPVLAGADRAALQAAAQRLAAGELVAFPTETVYGLGARADDEAAVARIYAAKGRPSDHPLIVHVGSLQAAFEFASALNDDAQRLVQAFWPGPLTVIVPRRPGRAQAAAGGQDSIGLRMPAHPVALALLQAAAAQGVAGVAAPSANRFGRISPTRASHVVQEFGPALWVLDGGPCAVGIESAIVDCRGTAPALLRPGQLGRARIEAVLGRPLLRAGAQSPRAPGMLASHYAPRARLRLFSAEGPVGLAPAPWFMTAGQAHPPPPTVRPDYQGVESAGVYSRAEPATFEGPSAALQWRRMPDQAEAVARELFAVLRELDEAGVSTIWVERPPADSAWDGVRDRLQRASV
jgi:L-threonylcarbamoyladenylate synthase